MNDLGCDALLKQMGRVGQQHTPSASSAPAFTLSETWVARATGAIAAQQRAETLPQQPARRTWQHWLYGAAAALFLSMGLIHDQVPLRGALAHYSLTIAGDNQAQRSSQRKGHQGDQSIVISPGNRLVLTLRPQHPSDQSLTAALWLMRRDGALPVEMTVEIAAGGAVRMHGIVGRELELTTGPATLWAVVAQAGHLPKAQQLQELDQATHTGHWYATPIHLKLQRDEG